MSIVNVRAKILEKLNSLQTLKAAFDWETSNSAGKYPFATLTLREGRGTWISTSHSERIRGFRVRIYQERSKVGQGPEAAEDISSNVIDEVEVAFDMDTTLSGSVKYIQPVSWAAGYVDRELDTRILEIDIDACEVLESI